MKGNAIKAGGAGSAWRVAVLLAVVCAAESRGEPGGEVRNGKMDTTAAAGAAETEASSPRVLEARGRALVRAAEGGRYRGRAEAGLVLSDGDALVTGPDARVEVGFAGDGRWRVGQQAIWRCRDATGNAVLTAGSALAAVPRGRVVRVEGVDATIRLGEGVWLVSAVANDGFKIVALDRGTVWRENEKEPESATAKTETEKADEAAGAAELRLRAGEVVFAQPGGRGFGPVVTVFLDELLATSRLVAGFEVELPQAERLRQQGAAQREALKSVSNAFVGGARDATGFQLVVPKTHPGGPASARGAEEVSDGAAQTRTRPE